jgi:hypothetical protein
VAADTALLVIPLFTAIAFNVIVTLLPFPVTVIGAEYTGELVVGVDPSVV